MRQKLERYQELDFTFGGSRECQFLTDLTTAFEDFNLDDFTDHVYNYDNVSKLDAWKTS
jgi:alpha-soluble NSF attachment protein